MNWKKFTPLAVAIVLGLFAARLGMKLVENGGPRIVEQTNLVPVIVAARDIEPGTSLAELDVTIAKVPAETVAIGAFTSAAQASGKVLKTSMLKGQTLTPNLIADDGAGYGLGATLPQGMRAVTVDVNESASVAGFILPHCWVDVIATLSDGNTNKSIVKTIVESVSVIAVGQRTNPTAPNDPQAPPVKTATLLVSPKQAERLELAATMSRVRLVLRNGHDKTASTSDGITLAELKGRDTDPFADSNTMKASTTQPATQIDILPVTNVTPIAPVKKTWTVQMIKGGQLTTQTFDLPAEAPKASEETIDTVVHNDPEKQD